MKLIAAACSIVLCACLHAQVSEGGKLLDDLLAHPGSYWQVCDFMTAPSDIPYRAFEISDFSGGSFSKSNVERIGKNRDVLVNAIKTRLKEIDFTRKPVQPGVDSKPEENFDGDAYGCDSQSLNPLLLELIHRLKAMETLPELLGVEDRLVKEIAKAKDDAKVAPPNVAGWSVVEVYHRAEGADEVKRERRQVLFQARVAQRDLVMLMALFMREKSYEPYLKSSLEARYAKGLRALAAQHKFPKVADGVVVPKEIGGIEVVLDPVTHLLRVSREAVLIPYTRESRDEIRAAAGKWIEEHP